MITTRFVRDAHEDTRQRAYRARRPEANGLARACYLRDGADL